MSRGPTRTTPRHRSPRGATAPSGSRLPADDEPRRRRTITLVASGGTADRASGITSREDRRSYMPAFFGQGAPRVGEEELEAFATSRGHRDKSYSIVDCLSFLIMQKRGITKPGRWTRTSLIASPRGRGPSHGSGRRNRRCVRAGQPAPRRGSPRPRPQGAAVCRGQASTSRSRLMSFRIRFHADRSRNRREGDRHGGSGDACAAYDAWGVLQAGAEQPGPPSPGASGIGDRVLLLPGQVLRPEGRGVHDRRTCGSASRADEMA